MLYYNNNKIEGYWLTRFYRGMGFSSALQAELSAVVDGLQVAWSSSDVSLWSLLVSRLLTFLTLLKLRTAA